jgi:hypothetical protein
MHLFDLAKSRILSGKSVVVVVVLFSIRLLNRSGATVQLIQSLGKGNVINRMNLTLMLDRYD